MVVVVNGEQRREREKREERREKREERALYKILCSVCSERSLFERGRAKGRRRARPP